MNLVNLEQAAKAYHERVLLDGVSLGISAGQRIGVVGRNGAGKTTLLAALAGSADLDTGRTTRAGGISIGYLPQVIAWQRWKEHGREFKCIYQRVIAYQAAAAQKTYIEGNAVANYRIITYEKL